MYKVLVVAIIYLFFSQHLFSQNTYPIDYIGLEDGLSQGFVTSVFQDTEGFIWAATLNGLNRYDGHRFRYFEHNPYDLGSLSNKVINDLLEVGDFLLIATEGDGLHIFDKKKERFHKIPFKSIIPKTNNIEAIPTNYLPGDAVKEIHLDKNGNFWLIAGDYHKDFPFLVKLSFPKGFWEALGKDEKALSSIQVQYWERKDWDIELRQFYDLNDKICVSNKTQKVLWFASGHCFSASLKGEKVAKFRFPDEIKTTIINFISAADDSGYFLQTENKETWYTQDLVTWEKLSVEIGIVLYADKNKAWIQNDTKIQYFALPTDIVHIKSLSPQKEWILKYTENQYTFCIDKSGNFWRANSAKGLLKINPQNQLFQHFYPGESVMCPPFSPRLGAYYFPMNYKSNFYNKEWAFLYSFLQENDLFLYQIQGFKTGEYWALTANFLKKTFFVLKINTNNNQNTITHWQSSASSFSTTSFKIDENQNIWFASAEQLVCFDTKNEQFSYYDFTSLKITDCQVFSIEKTADNSYWIATDKGLIRAKPTLADKDAFIPKKMDFALFTSKFDNTNTLNQNNIASLHAVPKNPYLLWIGTKGGGLNRLDVKTMQFSHFTTKEGLPNNVIYGILSDSLNNLWMSSNRGIFRYNPESGEIQSYTEYDGIQAAEFNSLAYHKGINGEFMFGGVNGLNVFLPKDFYSPNRHQNVVITGLHINNKMAHIGEGKKDIPFAVHYCKELILPAKENDLTLEFSTFEFNSKNKTHYYYYLKGIEEEWVHNGTEPFAIYTHLPPGDYTFKVCNNKYDLGKNEEYVTTLKISILPPWYKTNWAYLGYFLFLCGLLFLYQRNQQKEHHLKLEIERREHLIAINRIRLEEFTDLLREKSKLISQLKASPPPQIIENEEVTAPDKQEETFGLKSILTPDDWAKFQERVELVYPQFQQRLRERYPQLTTSEIRVLLLAKIGIKSVVESATILGISQESVKKTRFRLRKKINMPETPLEDILIDI